MNLEIQIQSLIYSLLFGLFLSFTFNINYKYLFSFNRIIKFIFTPIFAIIHTLIYFFILKQINDGILNYYFLILFFIGFLIGNKTTKKVRTYPIVKSKDKKDET